MANVMKLIHYLLVVVGKEPVPKVGPGTLTPAPLPEGEGRKCEAAEGARKFGGVQPPATTNSLSGSAMLSPVSALRATASVNSM
jgi:hypothetical protein